MAESEVLERIAGGAVFAIVGTILQKGLQFGLRVALAGVLGATQYGIFILGWTVASFGYTFSMLGLNKGILRFVSQFKGDDPARVRWTIWASVGIGSLSSFASCIFVFTNAEFFAEWLNSTESMLVFRIFAVIIPLWVLTQLGAATLQAFNRIDAQQTSNITRLVLPLGSALIATLIGYSFSVILFATILGAVIALGITIIVYFLTAPVSLQGPRSGSGVNLLSVSVPLFLSGVAYITLSQIDKIFLGIYRTPDVVGVYDTAFIVAAQLTLLFSAASTVFEPLIAEYYHRGDNVELEAGLKSIARLLTLLIGPVGAVMIISAPWLFSLLGESFTGAAIILIILAFHHLTRVVVGPTGEVLQMAGRQNLILADMIGAVFINISLNWLLVPSFGGLGAAVATAASLIILELVVVLQVHWGVGIHPFSRHQAPAAALSVLVITMSIFTYTSWLNFLHGAILLSILTPLLLITGYRIALTDSDKALLNKLVSQQ